MSIINCSMKRSAGKLRRWRGQVQKAIAISRVNVPGKSEYSGGAKLAPIKEKASFVAQGLYRPCGREWSGSAEREKLRVLLALAAVMGNSNAWRLGSIHTRNAATHSHNGPKANLTYPRSAGRTFLRGRINCCRVLPNPFWEARFGFGYRRINCHHRTKAHYTSQLSQGAT